MSDPEIQSLIRFLQQTPMTEEAAAEIAEKFKPVAYAKNAYFLRAGEVNNDYLFLENGVMRAFVHDTEGDEVTTHFYGSMQAVFQVASYFQRTPSKENIQALTDCKGWVGTQENFQGLFHSSPAFREFGRAMLVKGFIALKERTLDMITLNAEQRYAALLKTDPEILRHSPVKYIASYLGITDTSLSRIRKEIAHR